MLLLKYTICYILGFMIGVYITGIIYEKRTSAGIVEIDHETKDLIFRMTSDEIYDKKKKYIRFIIQYK